MVVVLFFSLSHDNQLILLGKLYHYQTWYPSQLALKLQISQEPFQTKSSLSSSSRPLINKMHKFKLLIFQLILFFIHSYRITYNLLSTPSSITTNLPIYIHHLPLAKVNPPPPHFHPHFQNGPYHGLSENYCYYNCTKMTPTMYLIIYKSMSSLYQSFLPSLLSI